MTENIQTPQKNDFDTHFDDILEMQSRSAAKRLLEAGDQQEPILIESKERKKLPNGVKKFAAGALIAAGAVGGVAAISNAVAEPGFIPSEESTIYNIPPGGGLWDVAEAVENHETVDTRELIEKIENYHPANIAAIKDGLQAGESIIIPVRVDPK